MTDQFLRAEDRLLSAMAKSVRGPKRNGLYALWLFVRQCDGYLPPKRVSAQANRQRLEGLERRLSSLSLPASLRRAMTGALRELGRDSQPDITLALHHLVAAAQEALGTEAAGAIESATNRVRVVESETQRSA